MRSRSVEPHPWSKRILGGEDWNAGQRVQSVPLVKVQHSQVLEQLTGAQIGMSLPIAQSYPRKGIPTMSRCRTSSCLPQSIILRLTLTKAHLELVDLMFLTVEPPLIIIPLQRGASRLGGGNAWREAATHVNSSKARAKLTVKAHTNG